MHAIASTAHSMSSTFWELEFLLSALNIVVVVTYSIDIHHSQSQSKPLETSLTIFFSQISIMNGIKNFHWVNQLHELHVLISANSLPSCTSINILQSPTSLVALLEIASSFLLSTLFCLFFSLFCVRKHKKVHTFVCSSKRMIFLLSFCVFFDFIVAYANFAFFLCNWQICISINDALLTYRALVHIEWRQIQQRIWKHYNQQNKSNSNSTVCAPAVLRSLRCVSIEHSQSSTTKESFNH